MPIVIPLVERTKFVVLPHDQIVHGAIYLTPAFRRHGNDRISPGRYPAGHAPNNTELRFFFYRKVHGNRLAGPEPLDAYIVALPGKLRGSIIDFAENLLWLCPLRDANQQIAGLLYLQVNPAFKWQMASDVQQGRRVIQMEVYLYCIVIACNNAVPDPV